MADDAGALLVRSGLVSAGALDDARARVEKLGGTLGEQLVAGGVVADDVLTDFYRQRLLVPMVNPNTLARLSAKVVATIPSDMAIELRAVPVSLDGDNNLTVAMSDPSDRHAVDEIGFFTGAYVVRAVATQMQIAWCLAHYYGHVTPLGARLMQANETPAMPAPAPSPPPRARGHTAKVDKARHRVLAPVTGPVHVLRPKGEGLDDPTPGQSSGSLTLPPPDVGPNAVSSAVPEELAPRARTASGEIRIPRAPSIKPPLPEDLSGPVITIEIADDEATGPRMVAPPPPPAAPKRRAPAKTDPPELAARAGEVSIGTGPVRRVEVDAPSIVISDDAETPTTVIARPFETPTTVIARPFDQSAPVVIHNRVEPESQPILLEQKRPSQQPLPQIEVTDDSDQDFTDDDEETDIVVLDSPKGKRRVRPDKRTVMGMGAVTAATAPTAPTAAEPEPAGRAHRDTEADGFPAEVDDGPTKQMPAATVVAADIGAAVAAAAVAAATAAAAAAAATSAAAAAAAAPAPKPAKPPGVHDAPTVVVARPVLDEGPTRMVPGAAAAAAVADASAAAAETTKVDIVLPPIADADEDDYEDDDEDYEDDDDQVASPPAQAAVTITPRRNRQIEYDQVDDGWGTGGTIPPPLLGAMPGTAELPPPPGTVPAVAVASAPLVVTPPAPPSDRPPAETSGQSLVRELEDATARAIDLLRRLDVARDRDEVIGVMIEHLASSHRRAGFFAIRPVSAPAGASLTGVPRGATELALFSMTPAGTAGLPGATLRLDQPSTLQDVVGTRLPYRGPMHDAGSRSFLAQILGAAPPEILLVPVTVRERVVGVLFGEHRVRHTFDDQLALAARGAGMALERILSKKKS